jgi:hypothetical protein
MKTVKKLEALKKKLQKQYDLNDVKAEKLYNDRINTRHKMYDIEDKISKLQERIDSQKEKEEVLKKTLPKTGSFTCYKLVESPNGIYGILCKLKVPAHAKRVTPKDGEGKSRVSEAKIVEMTNLTTGTKVKKGRSIFDESFLYTLGDTVKPDSYNPSKTAVCTYGIHVFKKKCDAENYYTWR